MNNRKLAKIFHEIALYLEMQNQKIDFRPQAYEKAAINLETLSEDVEFIYKKEGLKGLIKIPSIGKNIAEKIEEYLKTGKVKTYQKLKKEMPVNIEELSGVEGIGPKKIKTLYKKLKIKNLKDLEKAIKTEKIRNLPNFGLKTEQNILESIQFLKRNTGRFLLGEILPKIYEIINKLKKLKEVKMISEAGSIRRRKETAGDIDILLASPNPKKVINYFVSLSEVSKIWAQGPTKASIHSKEGFDIDLRVLPEKQFGSALQYFTGSKEHNIVLRKLAINKNLKLNEYGLFRGKKLIAGKTEKEIYQALKMDYPEPELRENTGEIEAAIKGKLPKIINHKDIKGDIHCHSNWNGGENSIEEMATEAIKIGYQYIGIADHTKFLKIENGLDEKQLEKRDKEIDKINKKFQKSGLKFRILKGCEANIMPDGSIDIKNNALAKLDFVIAGVHSQLKMPKEKMTQRIIKAMENPNIDIIAHPTGRLLMRRNEYEFDFNEILKTAKRTNTVLEINSSPERLDLKDVYIKKAKEAGIKMIINTDSHHKKHLCFMEYGVAQARRGWAEKKDIINCYPAEKMLKMLK
ncbi:DNA polymerase/3'-5' exonuclease PolX [Candidatus Wolfebacteria bacterium]|nr:DNA polymerase/3'-5' exonuclease PolX [Candidatus Wolfebacteria bacterium]